MMYPNPLITTDLIMQVMKERLEGYGTSPKDLLDDFEDEIKTPTKPKRDFWAFLSDFFHKQGNNRRRLPGIR